MKNIFLPVILMLCITSAVSAQTLKGDPWIFKAYQEMYNRQPNAWELNINNYNKGSWGSYPDLKKYIGNYQAGLSARGITISTYNINTNMIGVVFLRNNGKVAVDIVSPDGGKVLQFGGLSVSNLPMANQFAAMIATPLNQLKSMLSVFFGSKYTVQEAGTTIIPTSGDGALIIK